MQSPRMLDNKWELAQFYGTVYGIEESQAIIEVLNEWAPTNNKKVREFESKFSEYVGGKYGIAANSWVGAAHLLAILMDIKKGDEFIVPALTFQASANIFHREGAKIVFADVDPRTFNIDPTKLEELITPRTRAIVVVHMCGQPCDMDPILEIARHHNLTVIQDAAHAPGTLYKGKKLGKLSDFVIYSFHQAKNISTLGEGGMLVTNNKEWVEKMKRLRGHGTGLYIGISSRMTDVQGAVGAIQMDRLESNNSIRRRLAYYMNTRIAEIEGMIVPYEMPDVYHVYHIYNVIIEPEVLGLDRGEFIKKLWTKKRILVGTQYYPTVNCLPAYKALGHGEGECPVAEDISSRLVSLPISPRFTESDMDELAEGIIDVVKLCKK
ncbi:MAG TPA: DegT/DnrJ/EryC1/StrS family aminotransferase [Pseudobacteroides sp.]|uniref:DegT/DnrJ/EryC1/StrS family aminotransferase n=1 Tax=Pseudobacteroides sp. TaxID=1968840 RepID=UPI002F944F88